MTSIENSLIDCKNFIADLQGHFRQEAQQQLGKQLDAEVSVWLHRGHYERRVSSRYRRTEAQCCRCASRRARDFTRNGHRSRQLVTTLGVLDFKLPRVVCQCGGSVQIPFALVKPYQRFWDDVLEQVGRWANLGLSLRQMQGELGFQSQTQVGLRKLNAVQQAVKQPVDVTLSSTPPVIMLDAIWVTRLMPTETVQPDRKGRKRLEKTGEKVCVLVALGLYPQSGRWGILGWEVADSESQANWERLLVPLEARGLYRERGVELFIHDGGSGLIAALELMYPHVPHQRCLFHKLRNLWQAIRPPDGLAREDARAFKREVFHQVQQIFYAPTVQEAQTLRDQCCAQYADQTKLVETLCRDWAGSMAFHRVLARFPDWPRHYLRTTSLLERVNRMLRRLFRAAGAFHSLAGLLAALARVLMPLRLT